MYITIRLSFDDGVYYTYYAKLFSVSFENKLINFENLEKFVFICENIGFISNIHEITICNCLEQFAFC